MEIKLNENETVRLYIPRSISAKHAEEDILQMKVKFVSTEEILTFENLTKFAKFACDKMKRTSFWLMYDKIENNDALRYETTEAYERLSQ